SVLFYGIGSLLFIAAKREQKQQPKHWEWAVIILLLAGSTGIIAGILTDRIQL
ncbi:MAG TPA: arginine:ornithine antiporter, partial [Porphyromonadaceae bacterium]|nr:arginine:ornithine antiporter [Porphyromonadaceae bacterium]